MAILKTANKKGKYFDPDAKEDVISYAIKPTKMEKDYYGGVYVDSQNIAESMNQISRKFNKESGVQLRHFIISFHPAELNDPIVASEIACQIVCFLGEQYQTVYAIHDEKAHIHIHIIMNSISYIDGHRYYGTREEFNAFRNFLRRLLQTYGIYRLDYVSNNG